MKKSLIALAVLGTAGLGFSGAASAQSSVTMYGVADAGISRTQNYGPYPIGGGVTFGLPAGGYSGMVAAAVGAPKSSRTGFNSAGTMNNGTSRLGVRGVEDLGGGLKAGFNFETGLDLNDGGVTGTFWQRAANVWVGGNWGTFTMGRALNPSFHALAAWELTGTANYSVAANTYGFTGEGPRTNSMFQYQTPNFGGVSAKIAYVFKDDNNDRAHYDLNLIYNNGPIAASLGVNKTNKDRTNWVLGGKYSFGNFAVAAGYHVTGTKTGQLLASDGTPLSPVLDLKRRGFSLGGSFNTGPFTATLDLTRDTSNRIGIVGGGSVKLKKQTNGLLEGKYALSKRTFVYAAYLRLDKTNNYGVGLRHNF